ncbi:hypothetical protein [Ornithinibacillus sp. 179-J 7C1 HS]|uniref:hypothetical protein n=1 Tax=Ornithinibacillus sp. 179-J 7C1 HS TaxID=3142384 RepID=UPI0039A318B5
MVLNYEKRHFFMAIGIGIFLVSPILLIFIPAFIANSIYLEPGTWIVIVPKASYFLYGIGCLLLGIACLIIYFGDVKRLFVFIGVVLSIVGVFFLLLGAKPFIAISNDGLTYRIEASNNIHQYKWNEIETVNYYDVDRSEGFDTYEVIFPDGSSIQITENGYVMQYRNALMEQFQENNISFNWK